MGVAAAMTVLESKDIKHGPVEALFTMDEEIGMTGAFALKPGLLKGDILLNLDSEDEGELYIGCAGGTNANIRFDYKPATITGEMQSYKIRVEGLKGGHSGLDINLGKGNSNKILVRFLRHAARMHGLQLAHIEGGSVRNAIPREAWAYVVVPVANCGKFEGCIKKFEKTVQGELSFTEPGLKIDLQKADKPKSVIDPATQTRVLNALYACPNGVIRMSDAMEGLVETSTNMSIIKMEEGRILVLCMIRSSVDSAKEDLGNMIESVFELAGADVSFDGTYPGWKPNPDSPILKVMSDVYKNKYGKTPQIKALHAGLECGILAGAYPHWDMISFGPTIRFPHSPDEKVNIATVQKFWDYLVETLKHIPGKE
jgi:dipeptidase D